MIQEISCSRFSSLELLEDTVKKMKLLKFLTFTVFLNINAVLTLYLGVSDTTRFSSVCKMELGSTYSVLFL